MRIVTRSEITAALVPAAAISAIEEGFAAYSRGEVITPPVGHLDFANPAGEVHIKYGYRRGDEMFVVKIASGFYGNPASGLSSSNGLLLVLSARTGLLEAILLDEGYLTDLRTAAAGAVAAKYLAPQSPAAIGIIGAGIQARMQLDMLRHVTSCRRALVWARDPVKARSFAVAGFDVEAMQSIEELARRCELIVTTTPARAPLLFAHQIRPGTHITAVGADSPGKQELDPALLARADIVAVDSRQQCFEHGDCAHALRAGLMPRERCVELGEIIANPDLGREHPQQITVADLTGLVAQDIQIAKLTLATLQPYPASHVLVSRPAAR